MYPIFGGMLTPPPPLPMLLPPPTAPPILLLLPRTSPQDANSDNGDDIGRMVAVGLALFLYAFLP